MIHEEGNVPGRSDSCSLLSLPDDTLSVGQAPSPAACIVEPSEHVNQDGPFHADDDRKQPPVERCIRPDRMARFGDKVQVGVSTARLE